MTKEELHACKVGDLLYFNKGMDWRISGALENEHYTFSNKDVGHVFIVVSRSISGEFLILKDMYSGVFMEWSEYAVERGLKKIEDIPDATDAGG